MKQKTVPALVLLVLFATPLYAVPVLITEPDYNDSFTIVVSPRRNPGTLGTATRDGYPVFPTAWGGVTYIEQRGWRIPGPLYLSGYGVPEVVTGPSGHEIPNVEIRSGRVGLPEE